MLDLVLPTSSQELLAAQEEIGAIDPPPWQPPHGDLLVGAAWVVFGRGGHGPGQTGDRGWAAVACRRGRTTGPTVVRTGHAGAPYVPGWLLLREGPLLQRALSALSLRPDLLVLNATGRDHPRRCGVACHLGALLDLPTLGVTDRPLCAAPAVVGENAGDHAPLLLDGTVVGHALRVRRGVRPLMVHAGWRLPPDLALAMARRLLAAQRTPEPLRTARRLAREARAAA